MVKHLGYSLELVLRCHGKPISEVARILKISKNRLYQMFDKEQIDNSCLLEICEKLNIDLNVIKEKIDKIKKIEELDFVYLHHFNNNEIEIFYGNLLKEYRLLLLTLLQLCSEPILEEAKERINNFILLIDEHHRVFINS